MWEIYIFYDNNFVVLVEIGDRVQALQSVNSPDTAVLSFQKGDFIEVMRENDDGSLMVGF